MAKVKIFSNQDIEHLKVDSIEKSYTLGFLWGDGHLKRYTNKFGESNIHYPNLEIVRDDMDSIKDLFHVWGEWSFSYRKRPNRREVGVMYLYDKIFGWFLTQNDYLIKSTAEPTKILSIIPDAFKPYWWRGFIDADGCFYLNRCNQFSISGSYIQNWEETKNLFNKLKITKYQIQKRIHKKSKSSAIRLSNKNDIIKLGNYIYADNFSIGLSRKYNLLKQLKSDENPQIQDILIIK